MVSEAVRLLDEGGESALTFRALAGRLGGGVASIYWYVASKDELVDRAADHVLEGVLTATERAGSAAAEDPLDDIRAIAIALFDALVDRPWLGSYFMRDTGTQPNGLLLFERLGQQVVRLGLGPRASFQAVSSILGFVIGIAADQSHQPPPQVRDGSMDRAEYTAQAAEEWRALDPAEFPFLHHIVEEFVVHDDAELFRAGLDLLLDGLRLQAGEVGQAGG